MAVGAAIAYIAAMAHRRSRSWILSCVWGVALQMSVSIAGCSTNIPDVHIDALPDAGSGSKSAPASDSEAGNVRGPEDELGEEESAGDDGSGGATMENHVSASSTSTGDSSDVPSAMDPESSSASAPPSNSPGSSSEPDLSSGGGAEPCSTAGMYRCASQGTPERQRCSEGNQWEADEGCPGGQICVGESAECIAQDEFCRAKQNQSVCVGTVMHQCDENARSIDQTDCVQSQRCELGLSKGACAECVPGEDHKCEGSELLVCNSDGSGFELKKPCASADLCNAEAKDCTTAACSKNQVECKGQQLQKCNASQTAFEPLMPTCPSDTKCNASKQQCDACSPGAKRCQGTQRQTCSTDGTSWTNESCPSNAQHCTGLGQCVACEMDSHCDDPEKECDDSGSCVRKPRCGDGFLDAPREICDDGNGANNDACNNACTELSPYRIGGCQGAWNQTGCGTNKAAVHPIGCFYSFCTPGCLNSSQCPRVPTSPDGPNGDDLWKPVCLLDVNTTAQGQLASTCWIQCDGGGKCPNGYTCGTVLGARVCHPINWEGVGMTAP